MKTLNVGMGRVSGKSSISRKIFFTLLEQLEEGYIELIDNGHSYFFGDNDAKIQAKLTIIDNKAYHRIVWGGSIGAAEAYVEGLWHADSMTNIIRIFSRNLKKLERFEKRFGLLSKAINVVKHRMNGNSKSGSRTNIAAHYDLSNDMYRLFLDPHMQYSSAMFPHANSSLEDAQEHTNGSEIMNTRGF